MMQKKYLLLIPFVLIILIAAVIFVPRLWGEKQIGNPDNQTPTTTDQTNQTPTEEIVIIPEDQPRGPLPGFENDRDYDGVTDDIEDQYGTSQSESDTDGDGLSDGLEIYGWKTDPTKADTDGDGYADGVEIMSEYNPRGAGTLEDLKKEDTELEMRLEALGEKEV